MLRSDTFPMGLPLVFSPAIRIAWVAAKEGISAFTHAGAWSCSNPALRIIEGVDFLLIGINYRLLLLQV